jgi:hypothetical protein
MEGKMRSLAQTVLLITVIACFAYCQEARSITQLGASISSHVAAQTIDAYVLDVNTLLQGMTDEDILTFALTTFSGDASLLISTHMNPQAKCDHCILENSTPYPNVKQIKKRNAEWPSEGGKFYVSIYGRFESDVSLTVYVDRVVIADGQPQIASTKASKYTYFDFKLPDSKAFTISVSPLNGDPDVFVSHSPLKTPDHQNYMWTASRVGFDVIEIETTDPNFQANTDYHIGIRAFGFEDAHYVVTVTTEGVYTKLVEGIPISSRVKGGKFAYFSFHHLHKMNLFLNTIPLSAGGDPDIYVTRDNSRPPGRENREWFRSTMGDDSLTIPEAEADNYYIGVLGFGQDTDFQLVITSEDSAQELVSGISQRVTNALSYQYRYFKYVHTDPDIGLTFTITPDEILHRVDMFSSFGFANTRPDADHHDKVGTSITANPSVSSIYFHPSGSPGIAGTYYLGVTMNRQSPATHSWSYNILAATNQSHVILQDGVEIFDNRVPYQSYRYYTFDHSSPSDQDLAIVVNPVLGYVDLYVSTTTPSPSISNHTWKSIGYAQDTVYIPAGSAATRYYIGVLGASDGSSLYTILAFQSGSTTKLVDGVPSSGAIKMHGYHYYEYTMIRDGSLSFNLETQKGEDVDVYVSLKIKKPSRLDYEWKAEKWGSDLVTIDNARAGTYYIAVYGVATTLEDTEVISYTINAHENFQIIQSNAYNGPAMIFTRKGMTSNFLTQIPSFAKHVTISCTLINGNVQMMVNMNETFPTENDYQYISKSFSSHVLSFSGDSLRQGKWATSITAQEDSNYFISVATYPQWSYLRSTVPMIAEAPKNDFTVFAYYIESVIREEDKKDYHIALRVLHGQVNVYVGSSSLGVPTEKNYTFYSEGSTDRMMHLNQKNIQFGDYLLISVYGGDMDHNRYSIALFSDEDIRYLTNDQPSLQVTEKEQSNYFRIMKPHHQEQYETKLRVESCRVDSAPTAYISESEAKPSDQAHDVHTSFAENRYVQTISFTPKVPIPDPTKTGTESFYVGVNGGEHGYSYMLTSTFRDKYGPIQVPDNSLSGTYTDGKLQVTINAATHVSNTKLEYHVYMYEDIGHEGDPAMRANMMTACGVQYYAKFVGIMDDHTITISNVPKTSKYLFNVIATDGMGQSIVYSPSYLIDGQFRPQFAVTTVVVGWILIAILIVAFLMYFFGGMIYNALKRKKGVEVIPNVEFWKDLPFLLRDGVLLIWDGIKALTSSCSKRKNNYDYFEENPVVFSGGFETVEELVDQKPNARLVRGGYGTI